MWGWGVTISQNPLIKRHTGMLSSTGACVPMKAVARAAIHILTLAWGYGTVAEPPKNKVMGVACAL